MVKWISIILALAGTMLAFYTVATVGTDAPINPPPAAPPAVNPFAQGIASGGFIEAASRNIEVSAPEGGLVTQVQVQVGDSVRAGQPVMQLDARLLEAELLRAQASLAVATAQLAELRAQPRPEELPSLKAALARAQVRLADSQDQLDEVMDAKSLGGVSTTEVQRRRFNTEAAKADVAQAEAQLALLSAGAWAPVIAVAESRVAQANAEIASITVRLDRLTVRSPIDGTVLKRNVEPGQFASFGLGGGSGAAIVVGDLRQLHVRARVDEEDVPMLRLGAKAIARVRGVRPEDLPLEMIRIEPLALPKNQLMGTTTERVDTRVIEVLFRITGPARATVYPGQAVDVFIDSSTATPATPLDPARQG